MKKIFLLFLILNIPLVGQDITNKLGGNTVSETYDVTDSGDNLLFRVQGDGGILFNGKFGTGAIPATGAGTRLMWYPKKSAFRVGHVDGTQWDDGNIADYSTAFGKETTASKWGSTALGVLTTASGNRSIAMGAATTASGWGSTAMGTETLASGDFSTAIGYNTTASSYASVAFGKYNVGGGNSFVWNSDDPLFEIGIGATSSSKQNAMTVLKNGNVGIGTITPEANLDVHGTVKMMGTFETKTNGPHQAATDGFVVCWIQGSNNAAGILGYTDSNPSPTTLVQYASCDNDGGVINIVMPVSKGNYWSLSTVSHSGHSPTVTWVPFGQ